MTFLYKYFNILRDSQISKSNSIWGFTGAPSQPVLKESTLGKDHMSYNVVWVFESTVPVDSYKIKFRKVNKFLMKVTKYSYETIKDRYL
jgi:hypothetical protein